MKVYRRADWPDAYAVKAKRIESGFLGENKEQERKNKLFCEEDLAKSGLLPSDMAVDYHGSLPIEGAKAGYLIPYFNEKGFPIATNGYSEMHRIRLYGHPDGKRYTQPSNKYLEGIGVETYHPYIHPMIRKTDDPRKRLAIVEGEKKAAAIMRYLNIPAVAIGGCWLWKKGAGIVPALLRFIMEFPHKELVMVMDDDIFENLDVSNAFGDFKLILKEEHKIEATWIRPPAKIDD